MSAIRKAILSATLKAETVRIRHLRNRANKFIAHSRRLRASGEVDDADNVVDLALEFREAAVCPSQRARCANIALGYLKGTPYTSIENNTHTDTFVLLGSLANEISKKAGVSHSDIAQWMQKSLQDQKRKAA